MLCPKTRAGPERQKGGELACGKAEGIKQVQIPNCFIKDAPTRSSAEHTAPSRSEKRRKNKSNKYCADRPIVYGFFNRWCACLSGKLFCFYGESCLRD